MTTIIESAVPEWGEPAQDPQLTAQGMALIRERIRDLEIRRIPQLRSLLVDEDRDERDVLAFESLLLEVELWHRLLAQAKLLSMDEVDFDGSVSLGIRVRLRMPEGEMWVVPVHPSEAFLDDERVSVDSPLGAALIGKKPGEIIEVIAPRGYWQGSIVDTDPTLLTHG